MRKKGRLEAVRHERLQCAANRFADADVGTLIAGNIAGFTRIEVILAGFALHYLPTGGDFDALGHGLIGLECHMRKRKIPHQCTEFSLRSQIFSVYA